MAARTPQSESKTSGWAAQHRDGQHSPRTPPASARQVTWGDGPSGPEMTPPREKPPRPGGPFSSAPVHLNKHIPPEVTNCTDVWGCSLLPTQTTPLLPEVLWSQHARSQCGVSELQVCSDLWYPQASAMDPGQHMFWPPVFHPTCPPPGLEAATTAVQADTWSSTAWRVDVHRSKDERKEQLSSIPETDAGESAALLPSEQEPCSDAKAAAPSGQAWRAQRIVSQLQAALQALGPEELDSEGFVQLTRLLKCTADLQKETFGSVRMTLQSIEGQSTRVVRLDRGRRRVRLATTEELFREEAEKLLEKRASCKEASDGLHVSVPLREVLAAPTLAAALRGTTDTKALAIRAAQQKESNIHFNVEDEKIMQKPRVTQLQRTVELLFSDEHLKSDQRLRAKIMESREGWVPLAWLCSRYTTKLGGENLSLVTTDPEAAAMDLCEALAKSEVLLVDRQKLTVSRKHRPPMEAFGGWVAGRSGREKDADKKPVSSARGCQTLRQLLDFYFEPFTLQHNRYLLDLVAKHLGPPQDAGPWLQRDLKKFQFSLDDLMGLGRISSALTKIRGGVKEASESDVWDQLKHLVRSSNGSFKLRVPPEVRSFVGAGCIDARKVADVTKYMTASREERGHAVSGVVTVMSYSVREAASDLSADGQKRQAQLKRQLLVYRTDVVCLQGLSNEGPASQLASALAEEGYASSHSQSMHPPLAVFWDRSRWELMSSQEEEGAVAVNLRPFEDKKTVIRFVCLAPTVPQLIATEGMPTIPGSNPCTNKPDSTALVVCADLSSLGGAEGALLVNELAGLESAMCDIFGSELLAPLPATDPKAGDVAHRLRNFRQPDSILYQGLVAAAGLSGHTEGYLATLPSEELATQFPASRLPLVAAFDWRMKPDVLQRKDPQGRGTIVRV